MSRKRNRDGEVIETVGDLVLNLSYWDCECRDNFIHNIKEEKCPICEATQEESPNSRDGEVGELIRRSNSKKLSEKR